MADVITRFKLETTQYDSKLRDASKGLAEYTRQATQAGNEFGKFTQKNVEAARALGSITPSATNAKDKVKELVGAFNDAAKAYNALTKEQQQSDFGKAMAESLGQLSQQLKEAKKELYDMGDAVKNAGGGGLFSGLGDRMSGALQVFGGNMLTKAAGAVAGLGTEMVDMVQQGVELAKQGEGIRIAFERLGRGDILQGLREATHGTVTDLELMEAAVKFNDFKLPLDELGTMLAFAQQKAKDTGQSVDYMVDSIVTGLGRKSLMILDNLGLSAAEIKDKMAETGDMTKAVGAIIREQMAKAGDYVETAADRAAQADVELKNAMEELGRTFQPLTDASDSLWNSIKVGALNALNTAVKPLIQALSEAGTLGQGARSSAGFNNLGGNSKVDRMIGRLGNGKSAGAYSIYKQQLAEFDKFINNKRFQIAAFGGDNSSVAKSAKAKLQTELDGALKMREEYVKRAKELSKPVDVKIETKGAEQNVESLKVKLIELEAQRKKAIAAGDTDLSKNLAKQISQVKSDIKGLGGSTTVKTQKNLPEYADFSKLLFKNGSQDLQAEAPFMSVFSMLKGKSEFDPENILGSKDAWEEYKNTITESIGSIGESMSNLTEWTADFDPYKQKMDEITKAAKQQQMAFSMAGQAAENLGAAFASMEDPATKAAGTVISAIANIALGFGQAVASAGSMGPWAWLAYVAAGTAALATTISTVHSLTGYARGGVIKAANGAAIPGTFTVPGTTYSNDQIPAMLNAGETVLTRAQAGNIASQLQGAGGSINLNGVLTGENIFLSADRYARRSGRGELVTFHR